LAETVPPDYRGRAIRDELIASSVSVSEWAVTQHGFIDRKLVEGGESGNYIEIVRWSSMEDATAAAVQAESSPQCAPMFALIDLDSMQMYHGSTILETYAGVVAS
jgi:hypothetical protein